MRLLPGHIQWRLSRLVASAVTALLTGSLSLHTQGRKAARGRDRDNEKRAEEVDEAQQRWGSTDLPSHGAW